MSRRRRPDPVAVYNSAVAGVRLGPAPSAPDYAAWARRLRGDIVIASDADMEGLSPESRARLSALMRAQLVRDLVAVLRCRL